ncbi:hypothetical protein CDD80_5247 [Ophiocordyceps camponoti-rufipedis]|uniref:Enoyl-CoA hydratase n=1 Tax=Ophiocordyceps camponoti-rufipedis TaxID=2004952 RepID=A0A2C5YX29_9HYPO|nr:hypothetical protein CDD80_5247 [Ophiocordyceps camponoti-rufipedis]
MSCVLVQATSPRPGVRLVSLNRPGKRNALSGQVITDLLTCLDRASRDQSVKIIVVTGNGPFFCAGADLVDIAALDSAGARSCRYLEDLCHGMEAIRKPVVAAVNGPALGGGFELALMCDVMVASASAYFALPETQRGLIPGAGGTQRLTAAVGKFRAMRTILLGRSIPAQEALDWGLVSDVVADGELLPHSLDLAVQLANHGQEAVQMAKEAVNRADSLCRDNLFERQLYYSTFGTEEKRKGVDDFLAARRARQQGLGAGADATAA